MPPKAKNAIAPMTSHMMMLFIVHLRFIVAERTFYRGVATLAKPGSPDATHYALSSFLCLLEIQRKSNSGSITPPYRCVIKYLT